MPIQNSSNTVVTPWDGGMTVVYRKVNIYETFIGLVIDIISKIYREKKVQDFHTFKTKLHREIFLKEGLLKMN